MFFIIRFVKKNQSLFRIYLIGVFQQYLIVIRLARDTSVINFNLTNDGRARRGTPRIRLIRNKVKVRWRVQAGSASERAQSSECRASNVIRSQATCERSDSKPETKSVGASDCPRTAGFIRGKIKLWINFNVCMYVTYRAGERYINRVEE